MDIQTLISGSSFFPSSYPPQAISKHQVTSDNPACARFKPPGQHCSSSHHWQYRKTKLGGTAVKCKTDLGYSCLPSNVVRLYKWATKHILSVPVLLHFSLFHFGLAVEPEEHLKKYKSKPCVSLLNSLFFFFKPRIVSLLQNQNTRLFLQSYNKQKNLMVQL